MQTTCVIVVGDFNEDTHSKNMQEFIVEMGLCDAFSEAHDVDKKTEIERLSVDQSAQTWC